MFKTSMRTALLRTGKWYKSSLFLIVMVLLAACTFQVVPPPSTGQTMAESRLNLTQLESATYSGIYDESISLTDGRYEGEPFVEGGAARPSVELIADLVRYGDLTGDGVSDAAVILAENSGASGVFNYLAVQVNTDGQPVNAGVAFLGDRIQISSMAIAGEEVVIELVTQGPDEPMCCGTLKMRQTYALRNSELVNTESKELGAVSLADLRGASWVLTEIDSGQLVPTDLPPITVYFDQDGISGSAGCNSYRAAISSAGAQKIAVEPIVTTRMACAEDIQAEETRYVEALQSATQWSYVAGQLAITYSKPDGSLGVLRFAAADERTAGDRTSDMIEALFVCPDGSQIAVTVDNAREMAVVTLPDSVVELPRALSASGAR